MIKEIQAGLSAIEQINGVEILFAAESGSRVWGFESPNSDWDVRFIYKRSLSWYLTLGTRRDVIEVMDKENNLDYVGWDLRKALQLMRKSNPELMGWLRSPLVYRDSDTGKALNGSLRGYFNARAAGHHYLHMAEGNYRVYLQRDAVPYKKYLYVLRPLLCCHHIYRAAYEPPVQFAQLVAGAPIDFPYLAVSDLLKAKRSGEEMATGPRIPELDAWCQKEIAHFKETIGAFPTVQVESDQLDALFLNSVCPLTEYVRRA